VTGIAAEPEDATWAVEFCLTQFRKMRYEREQQAIQREIERLQELGAKEHGTEIDSLWARKYELKQRLEGLI
jgi:hypothetical protein